MAQGAFTGQVSAWVAETKQRMLAVRNESIERVIEIMQEPGPSKASTKIAIASGSGLGKLRKDGTRGASKKGFGPVFSGGSGNLPVDTGFLRSSLMASAGKANFMLRPNPDDTKRYSYDAGQITLVLLKANLGDPVEAVYSANYARAIEYGTHGRAGRRFVGLAAQQWPRIVNDVSREAQARNI